MKPRFAIALLPLIAAGCMSTLSESWTGRELRPAEDTPPQFITEDGTLPEDACRNPLLDPRDQARLRLIRSGSIGDRQQGDYEVPAGRYGVGSDELLRIDCRTGQPIGIVRS